MATQYFRITAYHPTEELSVIMDSFGMFEKLWEFSSFMISKGFKIIEVGNDEKFLDVNITKAEQDNEHIILRASAKGKPIKTTKTLKDRNYKAIEVEGKMYIPDKNTRL